jgi:undecaprenyl pyrophosphate phosphatase UppP
VRDVVVKLLSIMLAPSEATRRQRHTLGVMVLILVVVLVIVGSVFLSVGASPGTSLLWWGVCFLLIVWSVYLAYLDVRSLRHELRAQKKELFFSVFSKPRQKDSDKQKEPPRSETRDSREPGREETDPSGCR